MTRTLGAAVIGVFLLLYVVPLGVRPLVIPDETRYAEIPREMIASGDWIVPRLDGLRYFEKPILGYWLNGAAMLLFGENAFAVRFPSALAVGLSSLFIFLLAKRFEPDSSVAVLAAVGLFTSVAVFGVGVFNVLDSLLSFFVTAGMVFFFFAYREGKAKRRLTFFALFGFSCGLAFLTKGFLAFAVPVVAIVPFLIWERRGTDLLRMPWLPMAAAILVVLPWALMIHHRENDFWHYFFWIEHIERFMSQEAQHAEPFWFYIPVILAGGLPWTALLPAAMWGVKQIGLRRPLLRFAVCWFFSPFLFFSASSGKLGTYILPCFPPLIVFLSVGIMEYLKRGKGRAFTGAAILLAGFIGLAAVALVLSQLLALPRVYGYGETWKWILALVGLLVWGAVLVVASNRADKGRKLILFAGAPVLFLFVAHFIMPNLSIERKAPGDFLLDHANGVTPATILVAEGNVLRAVCWFYKRDDVYLFNYPDELEYGLSYPDARGRLLAVEQLTKLVQANAGKASVVLISRAKDYIPIKNRIPKPAFEDIRSGFVFAQYL